MRKLKRLTEKVLALPDTKEEITFYYTRHNDGTEEDPDITITRCTFGIDISPSGTYKDLVVNMYKEDDDVIYESEENIRIPFIEDPVLLEQVLRHIGRTHHSMYIIEKE